MIENEYVTMLIHRANQRDTMRRLQQRQRIREALYRENKKRTLRLFALLRPLRGLRRRWAQPQQSRLDDASTCGASSFAS
ncbi:MAG: hypothetical protein IH587_08605 [Anaerolineae bacterium]|nr:hypothetical protein [Anaerolineae bacterium]